jgi:peptide/nickel transport system permease protein
VRYAARRLLHGLLLLAGVSVLSFLFADLAPGDYFSEMRLDPRISTETVAGLRARAGLDRPLPVRYAAWVGSVLRGEFGYSLAYQGPVGPLLWRRLGATVLLTGAASLAAWLAALPLGIWLAARRGSWRDAIGKLLLAVLLAIPDLLLAIALLALAVETGWLPVGGMSSGAASRWRDVAWHLVIPAGVLAVGMLPVLVRHVRATMIEALDAPFALAARAHGIPRRRLLLRHLLPAAIHPLITLLGFSLGTLVSASLLIEVVTGWPGLGPLFLEAIMARDFALVLGVVMLSTACLVAANLAADLLLYRLDPRIRIRT